MANELASLFVTIGASTTDFNKALGDMEKTVRTTMGNIQKELQTVGVTLTAVGVAITGALALAVNEAENVKESQARLAQSVTNTGVAYNTIKDQVNNLIESLVSLTSYSNVDMFDSLNRLTVQTGSYTTAMQLLPTALDMASAFQINLGTASQYLSRAFDGDYTALERYLPGINKCTDANQALQFIMDKVRGSAEATANPFTQFKNVMGELGQSIGSVLLPIITALVKDLGDFVKGTMDWLNQYPGLKTALADITAVAGLTATAIGAIALALSTHLIPRLLEAGLVLKTWIAQLWSAVAAQIATYVAMGPAGWAILAGMAGSHGRGRCCNQRFNK